MVLGCTTRSLRSDVVLAGSAVVSLPGGGAEATPTIPLRQLGASITFQPHRFQVVLSLRPHHALTDALYASCSRKNSEYNDRPVIRCPNSPHQPRCRHLRPRHSSISRCCLVRRTRSSTSSPVPCWPFFGVCCRLWVCSSSSCYHVYTNSPTQPSQSSWPCFICRCPFHRAT